LISGGKISDSLDLVIKFLDDRNYPGNPYFMDKIFIKDQKKRNKGKTIKGVVDCLEISERKPRSVKAAYFKSIGTDGELSRRMENWLGELMH